MINSKKEILLGDCLELMKDIPNQSVQLILTDPPPIIYQEKITSKVLDELVLTLVNGIMGLIYFHI